MKVLAPLKSELMALASTIDEIEAAIEPAVDIVLRHESVLRALVSNYVRDYYEGLMIRGSSSNVGTRDHMWREMNNNPRVDVERGLREYALSVLDFKLEHGQAIGDYLPGELLAYASREILSGKTRLLRGRWYRSVAQACPLEDRLVRVQLTEEKVLELHRRIVEMVPEPVLAGRVFDVLQPV